MSLESQAEPTCTQQIQAQKKKKKSLFAAFCINRGGLKAEKSTSVTKAAVKHGFGEKSNINLLVQGSEKMGKELTVFSTCFSNHLFTK